MLISIFWFIYAQSKFSPCQFSSTLSENSDILQTKSLHDIQCMCQSEISFSIQYCHMSLVLRKPAFCICENKDADQLRGNREADQRLCFRYSDSTITLLPKSEISRFYPSSVIAQSDLCRTRSETPKTGFLITRLILKKKLRSDGDSHITFLP